MSEPLKTASFGPQGLYAAVYQYGQGLRTIDKKTGLKLHIKAKVQM